MKIFKICLALLKNTEDAYKIYKNKSHTLRTQIKL